jgi:hypothetical protein
MKAKLVTHTLRSLPPFQWEVGDFSQKTIQGEVKGRYRANLKMTGGKWMITALANVPSRPHNLRVKKAPAHRIFRSAGRCSLQLHENP